MKRGKLSVKNWDSKNANTIKQCTEVEPIQAKGEKKEIIQTGVKPGKPTVQKQQTTSSRQLKRGAYARGEPAPGEKDKPV